MSDLQYETSGARVAPSRLNVWRLLLNLVTISGLVFLLVSVFGRLMSYGLRRDELMFVPPSSLMQDQSLYSDFFYNHVPYSAWYFLGFNTLFEGFGLLGSARFGVFAAWLLLLIGTGWLTYRLTRSGFLATFSLVALLTSESFLTEAGMAATNNLLPLPFAVLGIGLFVCETLETELRPWRLVLAGVLLSIAAGMKVSAVMFIPPIAIAAFFLPAGFTFSERLKRVVLPLMVGGLLGAVPLFWYLLSDPQLFIAHVLKFHTGPHIAYWEANAASEPELALGLASKLQLAYSAWLSGSSLVLTMALLTLVLMVASLRVSSGALANSGIGQAIVVLAIMCLTAVFAFVPTPGFPQYYVQPIVCIPILLALIYRLLPAASRQQVVPMIGAGILVMLVLGLPRLGLGMLAATNPSKFTPQKFVEGGAALRQAIAQSGQPEGPVATLVPLYPLEADLPVYPEFATGPFAYRIAQFTPTELAQHYQIVGDDQIEDLFNETPPAAFVLGYDSTLEASLLQYALTNGYQKAEIAGLDNRYGQGVVYLKPKEAGQ